MSEETAQLSDPELTEMYRRYQERVQEVLRLYLEAAMKKNPPPDGRASMGLSAFIESFVQLGLSLALSVGVNTSGYVNAMRDLLNDIEKDAASIDAKAVAQLEEHIRQVEEMKAKAAAGVAPAEPLIKMDF